MTSDAAGRLSPLDVIAVPVRKTGCMEIHREDLADLMQERDELRERLARATERLGKEAEGWTEISRHLGEARAAVARGRAASLADFVRELLAPRDRAGAVLDTSGVGPDDGFGEDPLEHARRTAG